MQRAGTLLRPTARVWPHYNQFLLPESQRDALEVVLVSPRNPLNIGAAARAMANFGFRRLTVVAPYDPTWRETRSAVGALELLQNATRAESLAEAVRPATLVLGTGSLTYRKPEQPVVALPELATLVEREFARGGHVALVFGPEKHGLTREDLSYCHFLVEIPTDPRQPSMNLGQAVAVFLYELAARGGQPRADEEPGTAESASALPHAANPENPGTAASGDPGAAASGDLDLLAAVVEETMRAAGYSPRSMQAANRHDLRLLLRRLALGPRDLRRVLGLFRRILWRLKHNAGGGGPAREERLRSSVRPRK